MADNVLIFQHIPKTGGITLSHLLLEHFEREAVFHVRSPQHSKAPIFGSTWGTIEEFAALSEQERSKFLCIMGHMPFGIHEHIPGECRYVTILRDPVERILSQHGQYNRMVQNHEIEGGRLLTLEEYLHHKPNAVDNHQTRFLLGKSFHGKSDAERFEMVRSNFEDHFMLVGVLESFEETVLVLNRCMGWTSRPYPRRNVGTQRASQEEIPADVVKSMREMNDLDFKVHNYARDLLERAIASYGPSFEEDLARLHAANRKLAHPSFLQKVSSPVIRSLRRFVGRLR